jgi:hypothetical protein
LENIDMAEEKQPPHDFSAHPWLVGFEKKDDKQKIASMVEQLKYLENLIGTVSVIVLVSGSVVLTLMVISIVTGKFDLGILTSIFKLIGG